MTNRQKTMSLLTLLAISLTMSFFPSPTLAKKHHNHSRNFVVYDALPDGYQEAVAETVDDFNAVMPQRGPNLIYVRIDPKTCKDDTITTCGGDGVGSDGVVYWGRALGMFTNNMRVLVDIGLDGPKTEQDKEYVLCHEFMHELGRIGDNYNLLPDTSCVWGSLTDPGSWDIERLNEVWGKGDHYNHHKKS